MSDLPLSERLKSADDATLQELMRESEVYLSAQLTSAIAADQRAYTFAGTITAASILLIGGAYVLVTSSKPDGLLTIICIAVAAALFASAWMAVMSARSVDFEFAGNQPCQWIADIEAGKSLAHALAEQCAHYDMMATTNRTTMSDNSALFNRAVTLALTSVGTGGIGFVWWIAQSLAAISPTP